ncbi:hypothetical protein NCU08636 [Neurospora crassa OR74A]|uniref:Uncharacterized protein n=1 Tax=Neurospora crassa (strain ATCC 24698 / 74-OR23-1A / CBS 708.71 / DSM 1257 / FGSC 987) TaxID=367110 RepID=Q7SFI5_NEUCR|nr:hypothetical protein NCU08636 [Neurospora crassa OR74A]EAA35608.3 hypothetical protein NCU08636 [Neurospora crassa OR74A]|eukprot:XP_964844.3 hypothetical protein NCU08636 [Neurospora crassa OR74A]
MRRRYRQSLGTYLTEVSFSATLPKAVVVVHSADCHWAICQGTQCTATVKTREGCGQQGQLATLLTNTPLVGPSRRFTVEDGRQRQRDISRVSPPARLLLLLLHG